MTIVAPLAITIINIKAVMRMGDRACNALAGSGFEYLFSLYAFRLKLMSLGGQHVE